MIPINYSPLNNMPPSHSSIIVRLPNWVGDVVMALPALQAMHHNGIELQLLGKPWIMDLLAAMELPLFSLEKTFWKTKKKIAHLASNKALVLTNSFSSAAMMRLAGKKTIGYKTDGRQLLLERSLTKSPLQHEVAYFWEIARFASQYWFPELLWPQSIPTQLTLALSDMSIARAKQAVATKNKEAYWVLCPFAQGKGKDKQSKIWPHWRELSRCLNHHNLIVCPASHEEILCAELVPEARVLSGLNLGDYAALLAGAEKVVANDSGPMHLASAVGTDTLGIFGVTCPERTKPWGANYIGAQGRWPTLEEVLMRL